MSTSESVYPRWESEGRVSRFFIGPSLAIYQIEETKLIGGSMFVASASDKADLVGRFESERNAKETCVRDFVDKRNGPAVDRRMGAKPASKTQVSAGMDLAVG